MRNATAQVQLIDDMLDVSRIVSGKMRLDVRPVDMRSVVDAALDAVRPAAEAKGLRLQAALEPGGLAISGDPDRLQQVVWNLLINAVKFTPRNGRVQVQLTRVGSHVEILVSDTGQGMPPTCCPTCSSDSSRPTARRRGGTPDSASGWRSFATWWSCTAAPSTRRAPERGAAPSSP